MSKQTNNKTMIGLRQNHLKMEQSGMEFAHIHIIQSDTSSDFNFRFQLHTPVHPSNWNYLNCKAKRLRCIEVAKYVKIFTLHRYGPSTHLSQVLLMLQQWLSVLGWQHKSLIWSKKVNSYQNDSYIPINKVFEKYYKVFDGQLLSEILILEA